MSEKLFLRLLIPALLLVAVFLIIIILSGPQERIIERRPAPNAAELAEQEFAPEDIYRQAAPAVVTVIPAERGRALGQGSGFLLPSGLVATNAHVLLRRSGEPPYRQFFLQWQSGERSSAKPRIIDPDVDLALLRTRVPKGLQPLALAQGQKVTPGEPVAAIGSPFGATQSLSTGIISAVGRSVRSLSNFEIADALQTDAAINPGNSGGPLLNAQGQVIGINQQILSSSGGSDGVGYAVPVIELQRLLLLARRGQQPRSAYLGLSTQEVWPQLAKKLNIPANSLLVATVAPGGPAAKADIIPGRRQNYFQGSLIFWGGDVLLALDGQRLNSSQRLAEILRQKRPGERVALKVWRRGQEISVPVVLSRRPRAGVE
jgi:S1-C subfamily serine protease